MRRTIAIACAWLTISGALSTAQSPERVDRATIAAIRDEGLRRSQVMDHISWLADVYGPRVTGTPAFAQSSEWAMRKMREWGLANVHQERFPFGRGWSLVRYHAQMTEPQVQPLIGFPKAWSPSTPGPIAADVVRLEASSGAELQKYRGTLRGKIVLTQPAREVRMLEGRVVLRMTPADEAEALRVPPPPPPPGPRPAPAEPPFSQVLEEFLRTEGVAAAFDRGSDDMLFAGGSDLSWQTPRTDGGTVFPGTAPGRDPSAALGVPSVTLAVEHYNRMVRVLDKGLPVRVTLDLETRYHDEREPNGINTIGELPGTDLADQIVLLSAHLDSTHGSTGATDNATGVAAMLEAVRILTTLGVRPRRTIRVGLWGGEEQGLLGSRAYARTHLGDPDTMTVTPAHGALSAVFNLDNGTGRIRGIWMQGNAGVQPVFRAWIDPLEDLGVTLLGPRSVTSTDHVPFDDLGIPAFQFVQERLEYNSRTHHSTMDFYDRVQREEMTQVATVVAVFALNAAMRDAPLPRKPLPAARRPAGSGAAGRP